MNKKLFFLIIVFFSFSGFSQVKIFTDKEYAQSPRWITMMEIEGVNFNEAIKAYDIYWENHKLPEEEGDRYIRKEERAKKKISKKELKAIREGEEMRFQIKKFQHWRIKNEPFVKENGNIMTADERLKFHNQHQ